mmetsp:Transcript_46191/g.100349  ORF Transcript_46191/g.100349 Transcript_46191/m.100349 type:complete len:482 (+) Transcript_46191:1-1446(+)
MHYCSTYADMITVLRTCYPEFPSEKEGGPPSSFTRILLSTVQSEYESLPRTLEPTDEMIATSSSPEDLAQQTLAMKKKFLANMKLIGHLYLRQLISIKIIQAVTHELLSYEDGYPPEEHMVECVIELVSCIGHTLEEATAEGKQLVNECTSQLADMRTNSGYCKRTQLLILDFLDLRKGRWKRKVKHESAKKVSEVHKAARRSAFNGEFFRFEIAGAPPTNLQELQTFRPPVKTKAKPKPVPTGDQPEAKGFGTELCRSFMLGRCNRGTKCRFIHDKNGSLDQPPEAVPELEAPEVEPAEALPQTEQEVVEEQLFPDEIVEVYADLQENQAYDEAAVARILSYYTDDLDDEALVLDWEGLGFSDAAARRAVADLLVRGFMEPAARGRTLAKALGVLFRNALVPEDAAFTPLRKCLDDLDDIIVDNPHAKEFFFVLGEEAMKERNKAHWAFTPLVKHHHAFMITSGLSADGLRALHAAARRS